MRIASLHTYPIKGSRRHDHAEAVVEPHGLAGDRRWAFLDSDGVCITQRELPHLALLRTRPDPDGLTLSAGGLPDLRVERPHDGPKEFARAFKNKPPFPVRVADADDWAARFLGVPARLAWLDDVTARPVQTHARDGDHVSFADGYPLLLTNEASLDDLGQKLRAGGDEPVPMTRFRPNVVVTGAGPWQEDEWLGRRLRIGDVTFRGPKDCARCVVTTTDQETGLRTGQPLRILGKHRRIDGRLIFGLNLIPDGTGVIRVGDEVLVVD